MVRALFVILCACGMFAGLGGYFYGCYKLTEFIFTKTHLCHPALIFVGLLALTIACLAAYMDYDSRRP